MAGAVVEADHAVDEGDLDVVPVLLLAIGVAIAGAEHLLGVDDLADDFLAVVARPLFVAFLVLVVGDAILGQGGDIATLNVKDFSRGVDRLRGEDAVNDHAGCHTR